MSCLVLEENDKEIILAVVRTVLDRNGVDGPAGYLDAVAALTEFSASILAENVLVDVERVLPDGSVQPVRIGMHELEQAARTFRIAGTQEER